MSPPSAFFGGSSLYSRIHALIAAWAWLRLTNQCSLKQFVAQPAVEALDVGVLVRLPRFDQPQGDAAPVRPGQHGPSLEFLAVVRADDCGLVSTLTELVEQTGRSGRDP